MLSFALSLFLFGCSDKGATTADCPKQKECPKCPEAKASTASLSEAEEALLKTSIEDLRKGIRPFDDQSVGICVGTARECVEFKGKEALDLPEGEYILFARLTAPKITPEEKWKVGFTRDCETVKKTKNGESKTSNNFSKEYKINYGPKGYRLSPLATIKSPYKYGAQTCQWKLTLHNPNGIEEISGTWSVPGVE